MFTVRGIWQGRPAEVAWDEGAVTSNLPLLADLITTDAAEGNLIELRLGGPQLQANIGDPAAALLLIRKRLDRIVSEEGALPDLQAYLARTE